MIPKALSAALLFTGSALVVSAAFSVGGTAYTKRAETALLSEPKVLSAPTATIAFGRKLKIDEQRGGWLRVSEGKKTGWVFAGNLAETNPAAARGVDGLPVSASETSASTAARPLTPTSEQYSERHGLADAAGDLNWLQQLQNEIGPDEVQTFLREQKKGEFQ